MSGPKMGSAVLMMETQHTNASFPLNKSGKRFDRGPGCGRAPDNREREEADHSL